jgi:hypothetical protein
MAKQNTLFTTSIAAGSATNTSSVVGVGASTGDVPWLVISMTKSAGGNIDTAAEKLHIDISFDGTVFAPVYQSPTDTAAVNFLAPFNGSASALAAFPLAPAPIYRARVLGDGSADAWTVTQCSIWSA